MQAWNLTPEAFQRLLGALDPDQDRAAEAYERLRTRTIGLLQWWGAADAEAITAAPTTLAAMSVLFT